MRAPRLLAAAFALLLAAPAAWAQGSRPTGPAQGQGAVAASLEENRREAAILAEAFDIPRQVESLLREARNEMIRATMAASGLPEEEAAAIVDEIMMPNFKARAQELVTEMIEPYAVNFTYSDLRALRAFYTSPLGQKLLRVTPLAQAQARAAGLAWGHRVFQESVDRHADELRARGLKF
jgi:hypothetical protein